MLKDITMGQFFPGESLLHKMNPSLKIIATVLYIVAVFLCKSAAAFAFIFTITVLIIIVSGVPVKVILRSVRPLIFILVFTTVYNVFFTKGDTLLFSLGFVRVYREGVFNAVLIAVRILCLLVGSSVVLTYTTSPIMLTDGLETLLKPLTWIGVDVHTFAMMMSIALRFIPTLIEETDKIISAQKARGADFESGNLIRRARALIPILVPLFASSIRHAVDLATAMECRCYRGGRGRTKMTTLRPDAADWIVLLFFALLIPAAILLNVYVPFFSI